MIHPAPELAASRPTILTVPGLDGSGPAHWQTLWEQTRSDCVRADLGQWSDPRRNAWVTTLDRTIRSTAAPVLLVAHSLGCLAVAWWAELAGQTWGWPVAGALLVAPPDVERRGAGAAIERFAPAPRSSLPFPSILAASDDDPYCDRQRAFDMACNWGSHFVDLGSCGHVNTASGIGLWQDGQRLLELLIHAAEGPVAHGAAPSAARAMLTAGIAARGPAAAVPLSTMSHGLQ